jgi:hypothetical protein
MFAKGTTPEKNYNHCYPKGEEALLDDVFDAKMCQLISPIIEMFTVYRGVFSSQFKTITSNTVGKQVTRVGHSPCAFITKKFLWHSMQLLPNTKLPTEISKRKSYAAF